MATAPRYEIEYYTASVRDDDNDASLHVRRNGKAFYIRISPSQFVNSPKMTEKYFTYLSVLRSGEEVVGDILDTDVCEWIMSPFQQLLVEFAPDPQVAFEDIQVTLHQRLFPEFFVFDLEIIDEEFCPRHIPMQSSPYRPSFIRFDDDFLDELEEWTILYDPKGITVSLENPVDALSKPPRKVVIQKTKVECFFKPCYSGVQAERELKAYKAIMEAGLDRELNLGRVHGIVMDDCDFVLGLLLSHIDSPGLPLSMRIHPKKPDNPPTALRQKWTDQLESTVRRLHEAGIVWGDVKADNVLIDGDGDAWIIDFGGGYTQGWVDKEMAETIEGDLMAMAKMREFLFPQNVAEG